eukprot:1192823-Prorocentrum_minimum.AAC.2
MRTAPGPTPATGAGRTPIPPRPQTTPPLMLAADACTGQLCSSPSLPLGCPPRPAPAYPWGSCPTT